MGYDVTFHPISVRELEAFVFDVYRDPALAAERAMLLAGHSEEQFVRENIYARFPEFRTALESGKGQFASTLGFAAAALAGYLHPYWYCRGGALCLWSEAEQALRPVLEDLSSVAPDLFPTRHVPGFVGNYCAGGYVSHAKLGELAGVLKDRKLARSRTERFGARGVKALGHAIEYAQARGLGLIEATDVIVPISGETASDPRNLRAEHLKNLRDRSTARHVELEPRSLDDFRVLLERHRAEIGVIDFRLPDSWVAELDEDSLSLLMRCDRAREDLARNVHTPAAVLDRLERDRSLVKRHPRWERTEAYPPSEYFLQYWVLENPNVSPETLIRVAKENKNALNVMQLLATHPRTPPGLLRELGEEGRPVIRDLAKKHPNYPG